MTKVCLIDGSGYIFRAFYALPNMTAPDGTPVNAVYGFVTMFMRLLSNIECDYCVVLLDAKRENFRNTIYPAYKTNRRETPELLIPQFELIHEAVRVMGLPYVLQEGYEADDLIATYTNESLQKGYDVVVVSADKDLMQLIKPHVEFYDGLKDKFFTPEDVKAKFGVYPDKIVDIQSLAGDTIDNVPGVPGIGLKTAAALINEFGSLQGVLDGAGQISRNKQRETLLNHREDALISQKLVKLKDDVPVEKGLESFGCKAPDEQELLQFIDRLGFKSIRQKLINWVSERQKHFGAEDVKSALSEDAAAKQIKVQSKLQLQKLQTEVEHYGQVALHIIGSNNIVCGFSICAQESVTYYVPWPEKHNDADLFAFSQNEELTREEVQEFLIAVLTNQDVLKIAVDWKPQWHVLNHLCGRQLDLFPYDDVAVMSYDLDSTEHEHGLAELCAFFWNKNLGVPKIDANTKNNDLEMSDCSEYVYAAANYALKLYKLLKKRLFSEHKNYVYEMLDRRLVAVLMKMEEAGIIVNEACLAELDAEFAKQIAQIEQEIYVLAGQEFNLNSPRQVGEILYEKMGVRSRKTANGNYNTSAKVLEQLAEENEFAAKILEWRSYAKLKSTYTTSLLAARDAQNRVHTTFSQIVVNTGRLASSNPNLQNIPNRTEIGRKIRRCFEAKKGYKLVAADYSQMELRLMAAVANVKALKDAFAGQVDIHAATAAKVFNLSPNQVDREHRSRAKAINFGIIYGISQFGLARQLKISRDDARQYINSYFQIMPEVKKYMETTVAKAHSEGYITTPNGRKCALPGINDSNGRVASFAERAAINAPIQGGAADIVKLAMQQVDTELVKRGWDAKLLLQVHDELVLEVRDDLVPQVSALLKQIMENAAPADIKMVVDVGVGDNWQDAH